MGWFSKVFNGNPIEAIGKAGDALFTSDEERQQLSNDLAEIKQTPELPTDVMMELTLALLGLASLRTVEKIKGVAK